MTGAIWLLVGSLAFVVMATLAARLWLPHHFLKTPRLGLFLWFLTLGSAASAIGISFLVTIWSYLETVRRLGVARYTTEDWYLVLLTSFVPWFALAATGVLLSLIKIRLDPSLERANDLNQNLAITKESLKIFQGIQVSTIDLDFHYAFATPRDIVVSTHSVENLNESELEAVIWHELGHIRQRHHLLKEVASYVDVLTKPMKVSSTFKSSVEELCEIAADDFAKRRSDPRAIDQVREIMRGSLRN